MEINDIRALATAAVRDAANGPQFLELAEQAIGGPIELLTGRARRSWRRSASCLRSMSPTASSAISAAVRSN